MGDDAGADAVVTATAANTHPGTERTDVFGVPCFRGTLAEAAAVVVQLARVGRGGYVCLCNVHVLETAHRDPRVSKALDGARVVFPDGAPIAWVQRFLARAPAHRVGGPDLMTHVLREGCAVGLEHAFYGSTEEVLARLRDTIGSRFPHARIATTIAPPFGPRSAAEIELDLEALRAARPDVVWVALGAPRQELWAARHAEALAPALVIGVGAAFDFLAGTKPRAPRFMQRVGLEWLHRLATEPRRLGVRYVTTNSRFLARAGLAVARRPARWR